MPSRGTTLTALPFVLVFALAIGLGIAALLAKSSQHAESGAPTASPNATAATTAAPTNTSASSSASSSAQPTATSVASSRDNEASEMLHVHNELRIAAGAPAVRADDRANAAAQRHAEYLAANNVLGHEESQGAAGFTGVSVRDRLAAQGFADATASEVATSFGTGVDGVRSLWVLPYHRLGLMHPHAVVAGWGHAEVAGRSVTVGVIVYDFGAATPDLVRSPAIGQRVTPSWDGEESPDVLPAGAARPVGYPVMVVYARAQVVEIRSARLSDASGKDVAYHVVPQIYERDYVAIVPAAPLAPGSRYHVRLDLIVANADVVQEWDFETER